jgi:hypothetical protein
MKKFGQALGVVNADSMRVRTFELGGHTFKVKIPLTAEYDAMYKRMEVVDEEKVLAYYLESTKELIASRPAVESESDNIKYSDDDVVVMGRSMRQAARIRLATETRIIEMFKLLVPAEEGFDMATIDYPMIEELFPLAIQLQIVEEIANVVSPSYKDARGK